ncbi:Chloroplast protein FOR GROWTH AND FERTILITY 2 [Orobanche gracilis]
MGRLMHASSISCKHNPISPFLPRLARTDSHRKPAPPSTTSFPLMPRLVLRRFNSSACMNDFSLFSAIDSRPKKSSYLAVELENDSNPKPHFPNPVAKKFSQQQKAINAGAAILLSTIFLYPAIVPPAFGSLGSAAKAGAPALVRNELLTSAWTGFFAGCLHTLSGPDHLAALAPLSIGRTRMESAAVGALWGCGHDAGQLLFGLMFLLLKDRLHIEVIRTWGTRVVGFTLLVIGAMGIKEASEVPAPCVALGENGECDVSEHKNLSGPSEGKKKKIGLATFGTGIIHGLQPDALMMILPALALPSRLAGAAFLVMFLVGTVIAMGSYTVFIGSCSQALKERVPRITEKLTWASSLIAIVFGLALLASQYFGFSLY